jgi:hypothetical protein
MQGGDVHTRERNTLLSFDNIDPLTRRTYTMKFVRALMIAALLASLGTVGFAQGYEHPAMTASTSTGTESTLKSLETKVNDAFKNHDADGFFALVDKNAWSIDAMGFTQASEIAGMLKDVVVKSYTIEGYKVTEITDEVYLATYTWKGEVTYQGQPGPTLTYCSTLWTKHGDDWKAVFHQESLPMPGMPPQASGAH